MPAIVLLVEDDDQLRRAIKRVLEDEGCEVYAARDPWEAIKGYLMRDLKPHFILSDLEMPGMYGDEFCMRAKSFIPGVPFILMSAGDDVHRLGQAARVTRTFTKPLSRAALCQLIADFGPKV